MRGDRVNRTRTWLTSCTIDLAMYAHRACISARAAVIIVLTNRRDLEPVQNF